MAFTLEFQRSKPWRVLPGNGGIHQSFFDAAPDNSLLRELRIPEGSLLVINPRGFRTYVRNESFFKAIPLVLKRIPRAVIIATGMLGNPAAERWVRRMNIAASVRLLPTLTREQLASLFAAGDVSVSPSSHDGTPNTLLESMAAGCFPVSGNIESLREWIIHGENGLLCDPSDPAAIAACIIRALEDSDLRKRATAGNRKLVRDRAQYRTVMEDVEDFYNELVRSVRDREARPGPAQRAAAPSSR